MPDFHHPRSFAEGFKHAIGADIEDDPGGSGGGDMLDREPFTSHDEHDESDEEHGEEASVTDDFEDFVHDLFKGF